MTRAIVIGLFVALIGLAGSVKPAAAEYVWARSQWALGPHRPIGVMNNGYGGYYVPKNGYGNNFEGKQFTNPSGFVIPANSSQKTYKTQPVHRKLFRKW